MVGAEICTDDLALEISYWGDIPKSRVKIFVGGIKGQGYSGIGVR